MILKDEYIQGSAQWLALRKTKITASDAACIMELNPWMSKDQLMEEKLGLRPEREINWRMQRGQQLEPLARQNYEMMTGNLMTPDVKIHSENDWMMASLDGISIDEKLILEIKCTNKKNHELARDGKIPTYYFPQVQHQIYVCGVDCCHYFSFDGSAGVLVVVHRDDEFIEKMIKQEFEFYKDMTSKRA